MIADRILFVCTANECRSPYAEMVLHSRLQAAGAQRVAMGSAGLDVTPGYPMCTQAIERLAELGTNGAHRSRRLLAEDVESASLVLVAERRHRAAIVRMSPTASSRTFTLREAAALGSVSRRNGGSSPPDASIAAFAARLHEARGLVGPIELDIADGHQGTTREHRRALDDVEAAATAIANALLGRDDPRPARGSPWRSWLPPRPRPRPLDHARTKR